MGQIKILLFGTFWNFFPNIFDPQFVQSTDVESRDMEDWLYNSLGFYLTLVHNYYIGEKVHLDRRENKMENYRNSVLFLYFLSGKDQYGKMK